MTSKTRVVHHVHGLTHICGFGDVSVFINNKTSEERLVWHVMISHVGDGSCRPLRGYLLTALLPFHSCKQDPSRDAQATVEPLRGIHAEIEIELIAE